MEINIKIKKLREAKGFTHKTMGERLNMARSTYSKYESGRTELNVRTLFKISEALDVPIAEIIGEPVFNTITEKVQLKLYNMEYQLEERFVRAIPFDKLTEEHIKLLQEKGLSDKDVYEATPLKGRIYEFSPDDVFAFMYNNCCVDIFFETGLITDTYWIEKMENFKKNKSKPIEPIIDETDYCVSYIFCLKMFNGEEKWIEYADRDFPEGEDGEPDVYGALEYLISNFGAESGDVICFSFRAYHSLQEV